MCVAIGWLGRPNFIVVGDILGFPSIMFVDIHVERARVNKPCEKLTEMLTRTWRKCLLYRCAPLYCFFTNVQKVKQKLTFVLTFFKYVTTYLCPFSLVFHLLSVTVWV